LCGDGTSSQGRKPGTYKWYEIQDSIDYFSEFEKPKIVLPDIAPSPQIAFDDHKSFLGNTGYIIPVNDFFLLAVLNSDPVRMFYEEISSEIRNDYLRFIKQYLEKIPVPRAPNSERLTIGDLAKDCIESVDAGEDISEIEYEVDARTASLYGLKELG
jgi:hypothetical protein